MKKFLMTIIISIFPLLVFGQSVSWTNLTSTAELGRQQSFSLLDNAKSIYVIGGGINDEIVSYNGSQYYVVSGTASSSFPYTLSTKNNNGIYSTLLGSQYIYTESLNNTFNVFSCSGSQPYPGSLIWTSPDGAVWTSTTQTADPLNGAVVEWDGWIYRLGGVCACPTPVYSNKIARSSDGLHFATVTTTGVFSVRDGVIPIVSTDGATLYVVGGHYNAGSDVYYQSVYKTTDGATWTSLTTSGAFGNITQGGTGWSYNNILYVYNNATGFIYSSLDGITWSAVAVIGISGPSLQWASALYTGNNSLMVMGGYNGASYPNTAYYGSINTSDLTPTLTPVYSTSATITQTQTMTPTFTPTPAVPMPTMQCPQIVATSSGPSDANNYGSLDQNGYLWVGNYTATHLYKYNAMAQKINTYYSADAGQGFGSIVQVASDKNRYLWIGDGLGNLLTQWDTTTTQTVTQWNLNPTSLGNGGIQGVLLDGTHVWCAVAQQGGGAGSGLVLAFNPTTYAIDLTITGQTNVNGLAYTFSGGQEYIFAACTGFCSKINANTGAYSTVTTVGKSYRVCSDGTYFYTAAYETIYDTIGKVQKFRISDNALIATWNVGTFLNSINTDGTYLYTAGQDNNINVIDKDTGDVLCTIAGGGGSDVLYDPAGYLWGWGNGPVVKSQIFTVPTLTPTVTPTFTATPVTTPELDIVNSNTYNARVRWPNSDPSCTYLIQYGLSLEESQPLTQDYNISNSNNYFEVNVPGLIQGATNEIRITQYNPDYNAVVSNIIYVTPTPIPAIQDVIMTPTP